MTTHICPLCKSEYTKAETTEMSDKDKFIDWWTPTIGKEAAEASWEEKQKESVRKTHMVSSDINGYISQVDGSWIESRSKHRDHLKRHRMVELGTEPITKHKTIDVQNPEQRKRAIAEQVYSKLRYK